jgi:hypothetical protein
MIAVEFSLKNGDYRLDKDRRSELQPHTQRKAEIHTHTRMGFPGNH